MSGAARLAARVGHGVRAIEAGLASEVECELARAGQDVELLAAPVRVVVPSKSLRLHVASQLVALRGRPAVGLKVQTLAGLATEIIERAGEDGAEAFLAPLMVRREARREPALALQLDAFADAYGAVAGGVDDLLDAGFEGVHADPLLERIDALELGQEVAARAGAVVRVAARVADALTEGWLGHRSRLFGVARECVEREPARVAARAVFVYGFADATGVQTDFVEALIRLAGARVVLDLPRDPTDRASRPLRNDFGASFRERVTAVAGGEEPLDASAEDQPPRAAITLLSAPDRGAETRAIADRLRRALDAGVAAERLAVVARDLEPYRLLLRAQLRRLGIPFSGVDELGAATRTQRRLDALREITRAGGDAATDVWLDALDRIRTADGSRRPVTSTHRADLRYALHTLGAVKLDAVARWVGEMPDNGLRLGARRGLRPPSEGRDAHARYRSVSQDALEAFARSAAGLADRLASRPEAAPLEAHRRWLRTVVAELGWTRAAPGRAELDAALAGLHAPESFEIDREEFALLWDRAVERAGMSSIGGAGGGVQLLTVMEARGRSFDRIFVVGASRGAFPRSIREDPLVPDALRLRLREVLPDLPVKREGFDEERFLFAQLVSAAELVTLSYPERGDDGRPLPRSPLIDSLSRGALCLTSEVAPPLRGRDPSGEGAEPESERALRLGIHGARPAFGRALGVALEAAGAGASTRLDPGRLAAARLAVLDEVDRLRSDPGPYMGFVGPPTSPADTRRARLYVTTAERLAACPWQAFLLRVLGLSPRVDAAGGLPAAKDARFVGNTVHEALDRIVGAPGGEIAAAMLDAAPLRPDWPDPATLDAILGASAEHVLRRAAISVPGFARVLARCARPHVERARELDWSEGAPAVLGAEVTGVARVQVGEEIRELYFKADRLDRVADGLRFTDYKTGKPIADQRTAEKREQKHLGVIASGRSLQAMVYARAGGDASVGRYLFLGPDTPDDVAELAVTDEPPYADSFDAAASTLLTAWDAGSFPPRLRKPDSDTELHQCTWCEVKEACLRGDSGARRRIGRWAGEEARASASSAEADRSEPVAAAVALFHLGEGER